MKSILQQAPHKLKIRFSYFNSLLFELVAVVTLNFINYGFICAAVTRHIYWEPLHLFLLAGPDVY